MDQYRVVGPAAVVRVAGSRVTIDRGATVPDGADEAHLEHLVSVGLVAKVEVVDEAAPAEPKTVDEMTVSELRAHATARGVDLGEASRKDEILAAVKAAQEPAEQA